MPRFPPRGSHGRLFPRFNGTIKALRLPAGPPAAFRFLHLAVPRDHAIFAPAIATCGNVRPGVGHPVSPTGLLPWRRQDLPSSWGTPIPVCTWSPTPAGRNVPDQLRDARMAPAKCTTKAPTRRLSRLNNTAFGLAAYVSRDGYPPDRARLASRCWSLSWTGFYPQSSCKRFQLTSCLSLSFSKLLGTNTLSDHVSAATARAPPGRLRRSKDCVSQSLLSRSAAPLPYFCQITHIRWLSPFLIRWRIRRKQNNLTLAQSIMAVKRPVLSLH